MNYNFLEMVPVNLPYKIVGEYHNSKTRIKVLTEYGECLMFPCNIINNITPTVASAIDKGFKSKNLYILYLKVLGR